MDVYNEDITNDKKHEVLSKLWTDYYKQVINIISS